VNNTVQQTSLDAYRKLVIPTLSDSQKEVLKVFETEFRALTNKEVSEFMGKPINCVTPRVLELRNMGYLRYACLKVGSTGKNELGWIITPKK
jgi:hypothetical protein